MDIFRTKYFEIFELRRKRFNLRKYDLVMKKEYPLFSPEQLQETLHELDRLRKKAIEQGKEDINSTAESWKTIHEMGEL